MEHEPRAFIVATPSALSQGGHGANLRLRTITHFLEEEGWRCEVVDPKKALPSGHACLGVAVSYASIPALRRLHGSVPQLWLDATDSWILNDWSGLRVGHASYALRLARDALRSTRMQPVDLATWISASDRQADGARIRARRRYVLPALITVPTAEPVSCGGARRLVVAGDWGYPPNRDGLRWFSDHVLPRVETRIPETTWRVAVFGRGEPEVKGPRWSLEGWAEVAGALYRASDIHVAPIRFGAGVKNKVLQPLLAGLPVVTTPPGANGLRPHPLLDVNPDPESFAESIVRRLKASPEVHPRPHPTQIFDADDRSSVRQWLSEVNAGCPGSDDWLRA